MRLFCCNAGSVPYMSFGFYVLTIMHKPAVMELGQNSSQGFYAQFRVRGSDKMSRSVNNDSLEWRATVMFGVMCGAAEEVLDAKKKRI
jgi:hypothetical protein